MTKTKGMSSWIMTDLIFHMGLPKTATTTLQRSVLPGNPGYCREWENERKKDGLDKDLVRIFRGPESSWDAELGKWSEKVRNKNAKHRNADRIIVSNEQFSGMDGSATDPLDRWPIGTRKNLHRKTDHIARRPFVPLLRRIQERHWPHGAVKVILVFRNQAEWLASLYAQRSRKIRRASQVDFNRQVERLIKSEETYLDWSSWVDDIETTIGKENALFLFMEEIGKDSFWSDFASFSGIDMEHSMTTFKGDAPGENVNRTNQNTWNLKPYRGGHFDWPRGKRIVLTPELKQEILEYCLPFNTRLSERIHSTDISELGYFPHSR